MMLLFVKVAFLSLAIFTFFNYINTTIDLNAAEIEYLADHLFPEECRKLVASAHFKTYQEPSKLEQAERKVPKEMSCFDLIMHWNSAEKEGKGESHMLIEHRLRQLGREDLADWLGKTVFKELTEDLNETLEEGLADLGNDTSTSETSVPMPTFQAPIKPEDLDVSEWTPLDSICYALLVMIVVMIVAILIQSCYLTIRRRRMLAQNAKTKYERIEETTDSDTESEDRFDIRTHNAQTQTGGNYRNKK